MTMKSHELWTDHSTQKVSHRCTKILAPRTVSRDCIMCTALVVITTNRLSLRRAEPDIPSPLSIISLFQNSTLQNNHRGKDAFHLRFSGNICNGTGFPEKSQQLNLQAPICFFEKKCLTEYRSGMATSGKCLRPSYVLSQFPRTKGKISYCEELVSECSMRWDRWNIGLPS